MEIGIMISADKIYYRPGSWHTKREKKARLAFRFVKTRTEAELVWSRYSN